MIGKELKLQDLEENRVVALRGANSPRILLTAWVRSIDHNVVAFSLSAIATILLLMANDKGEFSDENDQPVRVYEYLGE